MNHLKGLIQWHTDLQKMYMYATFEILQWVLWCVLLHTTHLMVDVYWTPWVHSHKYTSRHGRGRAAFISIFGTENGEQVCKHKETTNSIISLSKAIWLIKVNILYLHCNSLYFFWSVCQMQNVGKWERSVYTRILAGRFSEQWNRFWNLLGPLQTKCLLNVSKL